jgi:asparagine synthase (glutamine-hydrolysing)
VGKIAGDIVQRNIDRDKGSLYRYGDEDYGEQNARCYLQEIEDKIKKRFIPAFLESGDPPEISAA